MHVAEGSSADDFLPEAQRLLSQREVENNRVLAILQAVARGLYPEPASWLWCVRDGGSLCGVAVRTPFSPLNLSTMPKAACDAVAAFIVARDLLPLELVGGRDEVDGVVAGLSERVGVAVEVITELRLFELRQVAPAPATPGAMRASVAHDLPWLVSVLDAFDREALPHEAGTRDLQAAAQRMITRGSAFIWEDGGAPVALAATQRRVGQGASIAPVFTPPALRRRGYAAALVAALSQHLLDSGCAYTSLFTDLANPISNGVYPRVGYRAVSDARYVRVLLARAPARVDVRPA
jgi:predicted GNAT family acetyltransferase